MLRALKLSLALTLLTLAAVPAAADEDPARHHRHTRQFQLPPERHVIEVVQPPDSGNFIINGTRFTAKSAACRRWAAGERIRLVAGDWNGQCVDAVFYNFTRRSSCAMWCRASWW